MSYPKGNQSSTFSCTKVASLATIKSKETQSTAFIRKLFLKIHLMLKNLRNRSSRPVAIA